MAMLELGSEGLEVERWQAILDQRGFDPNGIDGYFGPATRKATEEFQRANGLADDGVVGPDTWSVGLGGRAFTLPA